MSNGLPVYLNLGAGVQSSTLALMATRGEVTPMPTAAIFADVGAEPEPVYRWLDWLEKQLAFPVIRVSKGSLESAVLTPHVSEKGVVYHQTAIPFFTQADDGSKGRIMHRTCTQDYKIKPIVKELRKLAKIPRGCKVPMIEQWFGISVDEWQRCKPASEPWVISRWPLVEMRFTRNKCLEWMEANGYPRPPRSACWFCPFRSNSEWRDLRDNSPGDLAKAIDFDKQAREVRQNDANISSEVYLHRECKPLGDVDIRSDEERGQMTFWPDECSGHCGV